jgi:hypothetical protein
MSRGTCDVDGCDSEFVVAERGEDSLFVSLSVSPHDVEDVEKRAFSVCEECAREIEAALPDLSGGTHK